MNIVCALIVQLHSFVCYSFAESARSSLLLRNFQLFAASAKITHGHEKDEGEKKHVKLDVVDRAVAAVADMQTAKRPRQ